MENKKLEELANSIKKFNSGAVTQIVFNKKLGKHFLMVFTSTTHRNVMVFDENHGLNEIGIIRYSLHSNSAFISEFEVSENAQGAGVGRLMFEFAAAHADAVGCSSLYGYAKPTNAIKGVSEFGKDCYAQELEALIKIYEKLGCSFDDPENQNSMDKKFTLGWKPSERYSALPSEQLDMLKRVVEHEKQRGLK